MQRSSKSKMSQGRWPAVTRGIYAVVYLIVLSWLCGMASVGRAQDVPATKAGGASTAATTATSPSTSAAATKASAPAPMAKASSVNWTPNPKQWSQITPEAMRDQIKLLSGEGTGPQAMGPRAVGQAGHTQVRQYVVDQLTSMGLKPFEQHFYVTAPVDEGATLTINGKDLQVFAVWPNVVAPSWAPPTGLTGHVIDGGHFGDLTELDGKRVKDAIVVMDFNSGKNWENAAKLGAKAILFRHTLKTSQIEASRKFFLVPVQIPRFLLSEAATRDVDAALAAEAERIAAARKAEANKSRPETTTATRGAGASTAAMQTSAEQRAADETKRWADAWSLTGTLKGGAVWKEVQCSNVFAYIQGSDPKANLLIVQCSMDSMCVAPAAPHGTDTALQLIAGLNVARALTADGAKPKASVLMVFYDAHHHGMAGPREFAYLLNQWARDPDELSRQAAKADVKARAVQIAQALLEGKEANDFIAQDKIAALQAKRDEAQRVMDGLNDDLKAATKAKNGARIVSLNEERYKARKELDEATNAYDLHNDARTVLEEGIKKVVQRARMTVARSLNGRQRDLAEVERGEAQPPAGGIEELRRDIQKLKSLRDWYAQMDKTGLTGRLDLIRKGAPVPEEQLPRGLPAEGVVSSDRLRSQLERILVDARRNADIAHSYEEAGTKIFQHLTVAGGKPLAVGIVLAPVPGADQLTWYMSEKFGINGPGKSAFEGMLSAETTVIEEMARQLKLNQPVPLDDAFSIVASTTKGNKAAPNVSPGTALCTVGVSSYDLTGMNVSRTLVDTPGDTPAGQDMADLGSQNLQKATDTIKFLCAFVPYLADNPGQVQPDSKQGIRVTNLSGRVVEYDIQTNLFPDQPVPGSLAYLPMGWLNGLKDADRTIGGMRYASVVKTDQLGQFVYHNIPDKNAKGTKKEVQLYGFRLDADGRIDYALDNSAQGTEMLTNKAKRNATDEKINVVIAPARAFAVYDLVDPRTLTPLTDIRVLEARSLSKLKTWSYYFPKANDEDSGGPFVENCGVVFVPPGSTIAALVTSGFSGTRAPYLNLVQGSDFDPGRPKFFRSGYEVDKTPQIDFTARAVANDLGSLNGERLAAVGKFGIRNPVLDNLHRDSSEKLADADRRYEHYDYSGAYRQATHSWGVALRAYPQVAALGKDAVIGSVFFLGLVLPFSFFMERLTLRAKTPNMRVLGTIGWFTLVFLIMYFVHPAYAISSQPMIVLLAFLMITLVAIVASIIYRKFVGLIREYRNQLEGVHGADLKRFSASGVAVSLSLSTMARRKARTVLTGATLTMLAFAIVTFSSITSAISYKQTPLVTTSPSYTGLMFHMPGWVNMPASVYDSFRDEFGREHTVLPRVWKLRSQDAWASQVAGNSAMPVKRAMPPAAEPAATAGIPARTQYRYTKTSAILGLSPGEAEVFPEARMVSHGCWLRPGHDEDAVISPQIAEALKISDEEIAAGTVQIEVDEQKFTVVGKLNIANAEQWHDLDGESLMPADFAAAGGDGKGQGVELSNLPTLDPSRATPHLRFDENPVVIVQAGRALRMTDASFKSVAVHFHTDPATGLTPSGQTPTDLLERLMKRLQIPVFAGINNRAVLYESVDQHGLSGMGKLIVPIALAVFMIVNTLLGTVEERKDEIAMLNSVGLAPAHVGMLFLVEAIVYGVLGLVIGYLFGLILAKLIVTNQAFMLAIGAEHMSLNYSSGATIMACVFVLLVVVASAWYPARAAKRMATPGTLARWSLPPSDLGTLTIEVPFTLTGGNALGMLGFLDEYLAGHHDATSPDFRVVRRYFAEESVDAAINSDGSTELVLAGDAFLAPYDLGVSENFRICVRPTAQPNIFRVRFAIARIGGDMSSFRRSTQRFMDLLRRQFLIWRTLTLEEKQKYVVRATTGFQAAARNAPARAVQTV